jgi:vacuolar-type H+-ATPase subunit E/Vma4
MGWGIDFTADVYLKRHINSKEELEGLIEDLEKELTEDKATLQMMAISEPKNLVDEDDLLYGIKNRVSDVLESYYDNVRDLTKLYLLKELVDSKEGFDFSKINY